MKYTIVIALMTLVLGGCSTFKNDPVTFNGQHILVTDVGEPGFFNAAPIKVSELNSGGGVLIPTSGIGHDQVPNLLRIDKEIFESYGIKTTSDIDQASYMISLEPMLAVTAASAEKAAAYSAVPNEGQVISGGGQLIGSVVNSMHTAAGGAGGALGYVMGAMFQDTKLLLMGMVAKKPVFIDVKGKQYVTGKDDMSTAALKIFYKLEKNKEATDDVVYRMAVDQWVKHYVIIDAPIIQTKNN